MYRQTQGQTSYRAGAAPGGTDWQALELQLNRTRTILQEILVHLQEVLRNLKMARTGGRPHAGATGGDGHHEARARAQQQTFRGQGATAGGGYKAPGAGGRTAASGAATGSGQSGPTGSPGASGKSHAGTTSAGSERFRSWSRPGAGETRAEAGQGRSFRASAGSEAGASHSRFRASAASEAKDRAGESRWSSRNGSASSRSQGAAGESFRERPQAENAHRTTSAGGNGGERRETRFGTSGASAHSGPGRGQAGRASASRRTNQGFSLDEDRQSRARALARRGGMNLKCAYDILCLDYPCSVDEIKVAYRHMARIYHPDLGGDEEAMKDVNVAYEMAMRFSAGRRASAAWAV